MRWATTWKSERGCLRVIHMSVGMRRRVENSAGCLSEKRLFIRSGNNVADEAAS